MICKLQNMNTNPDVSLWISDFLSNGYRELKLCNPVQTMWNRTQVLNGACHHYYLHYTPVNWTPAVILAQIVKYAGDTLLTGFISNDDENSYRDEVTRLVN